MSTLPLHTFLKVITSLCAVLWCIFSLIDFVSQKSWLRSKNLSHALSAITLTFYLLAYGLQKKYFPLTNVAELFIFIGWFYICLFFVLSLSFAGDAKRSLDVFFAPIPTVLILLGLSSINASAPIIRDPSSPLDHLEQLLTLISILSYFYAIVIFILYTRAFHEIKNKQPLFITLKLPNLPQLKRTLEIFLAGGTLALLAVLMVYYLLRPLRFLPPPDALTQKPNFIYISAGLVFSITLIVSRFWRVSHKYLLVTMGTGFCLILFYFFTSV